MISIKRSYSGIPSPVADVITYDDDVPFTVVEHLFRHNMLDVESDLNFYLYSFLGVDTRKKEVDFLLSLSTGLREKYFIISSSMIMRGANGKRFTLFCLT